MLDNTAIAEFEKNSNATPPTFGGSVFNSFKGAALTGLEVTSKLGQSSAPQVEEAYQNVQAENQKEEGLLTGTQMNVRRVASAIPNILGSLLDPVSMATGYVGGAAGEAAIHVVAPKIAEKQLARKVLIQEMGGTVAAKAVPRTVGEVVAAGTHGAAGLAGFGLPASLLQNYEEDTRHIEWGGVAKEEMANGAMGFGFGVLGYGAGVLWHKMFPGAEKVPMPNTPEAAEAVKQLDEKLESKEISKLDYELYHQFLTDPHNPKLLEQFNQVLIDNGHQANSATYRAYFEMLTDDDMNNLKTLIPQELNDHPLAADKNALSEFTMHNRLDELRWNPDQVSGLKGWIDFMNEKLKHKEEKLREHDALLEEHIYPTVNENLGFSQKELFAMAKKLSFEGSHIENFDITLPENIHSHIKILTKIQELERKLDSANPNKQTLRRIEELKKKLPSIMTPKEELNHIREKLLGKKELPKNHTNTKEYRRLTELADAWPQAKALLDRVKLEHEYERQEAIRDVAKAFVDVLNSNIDRFGNASRVGSYLKERINQVTRSDGDRGYAPRPESTTERDIRDERQLPTDESGRIQEFQDQVDSVDAPELKKDFKMVKERYEQFRDNEKSLTEMVDCFGAK